MSDPTQFTIHLLVLVLPAKVPDVIETLEVIGRVGEPCLHDLVRDPRDLHLNSNRNS